MRAGQAHAPTAFPRKSSVFIPSFFGSFSTEISPLHRSQQYETEENALSFSSSQNTHTTARCDADSLQRVLRHLVGKGVFQEPAPDQFALNEAGQGLLDQQRLGLDLDGIGGRMAYAWGSLLSVVRTGKPAYHEIFGLPFWEDVIHHPPELRADFANTRS